MSVKLSTQIGVLTIHGMGERAPHFDVDLQRRLLAELELEVKRDLRFQTIYYQDLIQGSQDEVWERAQAQEVHWRWLRRFLLFYLSDAASYGFRPEAVQSAYRKIHRLIARSVDLLHENLGGVDGPLVVFAHSLGCHIVSNYIWDAQRGKGIWSEEAPAPFQRFDTTRLLFTTGCNIPLFVAGFQNIEAIDRPNAHFEWFNYYDRDDPLGWPLKPLSQGFPNAYEHVVTEDVEISAGHMPWHNLTPWSHAHYWRSPAFIKPAAHRIASLHARL